MNKENNLIVRSKHKDTALFKTDSENNFNHFIIGTIGKGKSLFFDSMIKDIAIKTGKTIQQVKDELEIQEKIVKSKQEKIDNKKRIKMEKRNKNLKKKIWKGVRKKDFYISNLEEISLTKKQLKKIFLMLPMQTIGLAVSWGINDTEFRDELYLFVENNKEDILGQLIKANN